MQGEKEMQEQLMKVLLLNNSIILCMDIVFLYFLVKKKNISQELFLIKGEKVGKVVNIGVGIGLIIAFFIVTVPSIMDVPYLIREEYCVMKGSAVSNSQPRNRGTRQIRVSDTEGKIVWIDLYGKCEGIAIGDEVTIKYLPYTHYGCVVQHAKVRDSMT